MQRHYIEIPRGEAGVALMKMDGFGIRGMTDGFIYCGSA